MSRIVPKFIAAVRAHLARDLSESHPLAAVENVRDMSC